MTNQSGEGLPHYDTSISGPKSSEPGEKTATIESRDGISGPKSSEPGRKTATADDILTEQQRAILGIHQATDANKTEPKTEPINRLERPRMSLKNKIWAGLAAVSLAAVGIFSYEAINNDNDQIAPAGPVATAEQTANTGDIAASAAELARQRDELIAQFDVLTPANFTTPEAVTTQFMNVLYPNYLAAGLTEAYDVSRMGGTIDQVKTSIMSDFDKPITDELFTNDASGQELVANIEQNGLRDTSIRGFFLSEQRSDKIPYKLSMEVKSVVVVSSEAKSFVVHAVTRVTDNGNDNIGEYQVSQGKPAETDLDSFDELTFVLNDTTGTWQLQRDVFYQPMTVNSVK